MSHTDARTPRIPWIIAIVVLSLTTAGFPALPGTAQTSDDQQAITLTGHLYDQGTDEALANVTVIISNTYDQAPHAAEPDGDVKYIRPPDQGETTHEATTDENGTFQVEIQPGWIHLSIDEAGYMEVQASGEVRNDTEIDLPMRPSDGEGATVTGTVTSADGRTLRHGWVSIHQEYDERCDGDVCYAEATEAAAAEPERQEGPFYIHYQPRYQQYDSDQIAEDGTFELQVAAGEYRLQASAQDHLESSRTLSLSTGETRQVDLELRAIPGNTVTITGTIIDATSGEPIEDAQVNVNNQRWGHWNSTQTASDGTFELATKPGYTLLTVHAERYYWVPCEEREMLVEEDASGGGSDEAVRSSMPAPCDQQEREHGYLSRSMSFVGQDGQASTFDLELKRAPVPDATFQGWVINTTSEAGIAGVQVSFWNEETGSWGQATTDEDGSYTIDVRAGWYTINVWADGYFQQVANAEISSGETQTLTLELHPGQPRWGGCCYTYAEDGRATSGVAMEGSSGAPAVGDDASAGGSPQGVQATGSQDATYQGSGGDLGPYPGSQADSQPPEEPDAPAPLPGAIAVMALLGLGAVALQTWRSKP